MALLKACMAFIWPEASPPALDSASIPTVPPGPTVFHPQLSLPAASSKSPEGHRSPPQHQQASPGQTMLWRPNPSIREPSFAIGTISHNNLRNELEHSRWSQFLTHDKAGDVSTAGDDGGNGPPAKVNGCGFKSGHKARDSSLNIAGSGDGGLNIAARGGGHGGSADGWEEQQRHWIRSSLTTADAKTTGEGRRDAPAEVEPTDLSSLPWEPKHQQRGSEASLLWVTVPTSPLLMPAIDGSGSRDSLKRKRPHRAELPRAGCGDVGRGAGGTPAAVADATLADKNGGLPSPRPILEPENVSQQQGLPAGDHDPKSARRVPLDPKGRIPDRKASLLGPPLPEASQTTVADTSHGTLAQARLLPPLRRPQPPGLPPATDLGGSLLAANAPSDDEEPPDWFLKVSDDDLSKALK